MDGAEQVARYPLATDYHSLRVDGNRVLLKTAGRFDLFRLTGDGLEFLRGYSLDSPVFDFEMHEGLLFLLTSRADVQHLGAFQIVDLSVEEPRQVAEAIPELIGEVPMFKAGHDLALDGHYAYILDNTLEKAKKILGGQTDIAEGAFFEIYIVVGFIYWLVSYLLSRLGGAAETRLGLGTR